MVSCSNFSFSARPGSSRQICSRSFIQEIEPSCPLQLCIPGSKLLLCIELDISERNRERICTILCLPFVRLQMETENSGNRSEERRVGKECRSRSGTGEWKIGNTHDSEQL